MRFSFLHIFNCFLLLQSCKVEDVVSDEKKSGLFISHILIRSIYEGEYTNNPSVTEMILLFNNGFTAVVQDTIEGTEFIPFRQHKVHELDGVTIFSQIESSSLVKRTTSFTLINDTLTLYYLPEGCKSMYFRDRFAINQEYFDSKLYALYDGEIRNTVDIIENTDKQYKFRIIKTNK